MQSVRNWNALRHGIVACLLLLVGGLIAACQPVQPMSDAPAAMESPQTIPEVAVSVDENGFTLPENFPGGIVTVTVQNNAAIDLDVSFGRVKEGASVEEIKALYANLEENLVPLLQMLDAMPSFNPIYAGQSARITMDFRTGRFLVVANEHVEEAPPPGIQYIWGEFTADELVGTTEPQADVTVDMADFTYTMPDEIKAGEQVWEYVNTGDQWHMTALVKLAPGATMDDVMNAIMSEGEPAAPPPFEDVPNAGIAPITPGERAWITVSLEPGTYAAICPLPDMVAMMNGGEPIPHMLQGMVRQFTVK
ncbi:MAG: hypothetical protein H6642_16425 [Caldilineaceae bacterium]|nr:hypothetical protein [Caldilineaceae bacterium]